MNFKYFMFWQPNLAKPAEIADFKKAKHTGQNLHVDTLSKPMRFVLLK